MKKLLKRDKPTVAQYFQSESQRKKTNRLAFVYGHKPLVAVLSVLVVASAITGIAIVQKTRDSKAYSQRVGVSYNSQDAPVAYANWTKSEPSSATGILYGRYDDNTKSLTFQAGSATRFAYGNGYRLCYNLTLRPDVARPNLLYNQVTFFYDTNQAGTNAAIVYLNGQQIASGPGDNFGGGVVRKEVYANLGATAPGSVISFCNVKTAGSTAYFSTERTISLVGYTFGASFDQTVLDPTPPPAPAPKPLYEILGTVKDSSGEPIQGVVIDSGAGTKTTDINGQYRFNLEKDKPFHLRTRTGLDPSVYSTVKATNVNHKPFSNDGTSYEQQTVTGRLTNYDFTAILKQAPASPAQTTSNCTNTGSGSQTLVEAENAFCESGGMVNVDSGSGAIGGKAALLSTSGQFVKYTLTAPATGNYQAVARMRSKTTDSGKVYLELKKLNPGAASELILENNKTISSTSYTNYTIRESGAGVTTNNVLTHCLAAGQQALLTVSLSGDPDVYVDQLMLVQKDSVASCPSKTPAANPTPPPVSPGTGGSGDNEAIKLPTVPVGAGIVSGDKPKTENIIDQNRWAAWGFPAITTNATVEHGKNVNNKDNNGLYINFLKGGTDNKPVYNDGITGCWVISVPDGTTANDLVVDMTSNDAGRNYVVFKASGNAEAYLPRAVNGKITWNIPSPVSGGGFISICNRVYNPAPAKSFSEKKSLVVKSYRLTGTGAAASDVRAPGVALISPKAGDKVSGKVTFQATATDASGIAYVEFKKGSKLIGGPVSTGNDRNVYQAEVDVNAALDIGDNDIIAVARDKAGNIANSAAIKIKVIKASPNASNKPQPGTGGNADNEGVKAPSTPPVERCILNSNQAGLSVEAETAICFPLETLAVKTDRGRKIVEMANQGRYVEYIFKVTQPGKYRGQAIVRKAAGSPNVIFTLGKSDGANSKEAIKLTGNDYYVATMQTDSKYLNIRQSDVDAGAKVRLRIYVDKNSPIDDVMVDSVRLQRVADPDPVSVANPTRIPSQAAVRIVCNLEVDGKCFDRSTNPTPIQNNPANTNTDGNCPVRKPFGCVVIIEAG